MRINQITCYSSNQNKKANVNFSALPATARDSFVRRIPKSIEALEQHIVEFAETIVEKLKKPETPTYLQTKNFLIHASNPSIKDTQYFRLAAHFASFLEKSGVPEENQDYITLSRYMVDDVLPGAGIKQTTIKEAVDVLRQCWDGPKAKRFLEWYDSTPVLSGTKFIPNNQPPQKAGFFARLFGF